MQFSSLAQGVSNSAQLEQEAEKCLNAWMSDHGVEWSELKEVFEHYFSDGGITNAEDPLEVQYADILRFIERPPSSFPLFKEKKKVVAARKKLGLTEQQLMVKAQVDCLTDLYMQNKATVDTTSSFYAFGDTFRAVRQVPNISPGLIAGAIYMAMDRSDLSKSLYQKTIALTFCFDMTYFLSDGEE